MRCRLNRTFDRMRLISLVLFCNIRSARNPIKIHRYMVGYRFLLLSSFKCEVFIMVRRQRICLTSNKDLDLLDTIIWSILIAFSYGMLKSTLYKLKYTKLIKPSFFWCKILLYISRAVCLIVNNEIFIAELHLFLDIVRQYTFY